MTQTRDAEIPNPATTSPPGAQRAAPLGFADWLRTFDPRGRWLRALFWLLYAVLALFAVRQLAPIFFGALNLLSPFLIGLLVAYVLHPIVTFVQVRLHLGRAGGILVLAIAALAVAAALAVWMVPLLYTQARDFVRGLHETIPRHLTELMSREDQGGITQAAIDWVRDWLQQLFSMLELHQPGGAAATAQAAQPAAAQTANVAAGAPLAPGPLVAVRSIAAGLAASLGAVAALFGAIAGFALILIIAFYYLLDMDDIPRVAKRLVPLRHRERVWSLLVEIDRSVGGFLRGQLIACCGVAILTALLLFFAGLKQYALLIGVFAGLFHFVPYLGPIAGAAPAILWVLVADQFTSMGDRGTHIAALVAGFAAIEAIDGMVFQPFIVGRSAQLHPLAVLLTLTIGAQAGIGGLMLAVPAACACKVLWTECVWNRLEPVAESPLIKKTKSRLKSIRKASNR